MQETMYNYSIHYRTHILHKVKNYMALDLDSLQRFFLPRRPAEVGKLPGALASDDAHLQRGELCLSAGVCIYIYIAMAMPELLGRVSWLV